MCSGYDARMTKKELLKAIRKAAKEGATRLNLSSGGYTELPPEIGELKELSALDLVGTQLKALPPEIGELTNLRFLDLYGSKLSALPPDIAKLTKLTELKLYGNELTAWPPDIGNLTELTHLDLENNQLTAVPPEIGKLRNLTKLELQRNQLTTLPPEIGRLGNLENLLIQDNRLTELPPALGRLTRLKTLRVHDNPLTSPPPPVVEQGTEAILRYLRERDRRGERQWVSKLLVVGEGGVGKTSLLKSLRGEDFDTEEPTTHGIRVESLELGHPREDGVTMQLNTWDFGGQQIYHATHQFFLTDRSLFVLVWDARHGWEAGKLESWLDNIRANAPESPVIIVAAHVDERNADAPIDELGREYKQIVGHFRVSNKDGTGIAELRNVIADTAAGLPLMGEQWPATWLDAANTLRGAAENYITPNDLDARMAGHDVDQESRPILARWLHELGDLLYFRDDPELSDIVMLNPQWVTECISLVLESDDVIKRDGIFTRDHMTTLWTDIEPHMRDHFLRLMEQFDLSYRTLENREISIVVERLSLNPPDFEATWDEIRRRSNCKEISMRYALEILPPGIPTWFIARFHRFTTHTHWRYGGLFADGAERKHLALVRASPQKCHIEVTVRGPAPHNFFALVKDGLDETLGRFPGLTIKRTIPCTGHGEEQCPFQFDFGLLEKAIERQPPVTAVQCGESFENVRVLGLLFGLHWRTEADVIAHMKELAAEANRANAQRHEEVMAELSDLGEYVQREFLKAFHREQAKIESHCPGVFVLYPAGRNRWVKKLAGEKIDLHLCCQAPGCWHPTNEGGRYVIENPPEWLDGIAPWVSRMVGLLKYVSPVVGPWLGVGLPNYAETFASHIKLTEELVKKLPEITESKDRRLAEKSAEYGMREERAEGAALRRLRSFLDEKDPDHDWGGLKKILTPEGHYLWLCDYHAQEYAR